MGAPASVILGGEPYNFSSSMVGLSYLATLLGVIFGALYTGYVSDWMTLKLTRRNGGIFEPEQRLWGFALTTIVLPASLLLWGVGKLILCVHSKRLIANLHRCRTSCSLVRPDRCYARHGFL